MKKLVLTFLTAILVLALAACGTSDKGKEEKEGAAGDAKEITVKVAATPIPHAEILKEVQPILKEKGINLEIKEFTDYVQPNVQVFEKQYDANFFQHLPYLEQFNKDNKMDLVSVAPVHIEPIGAYSKKIKNIDELKNGATIALPNDPTNNSRALSLLDKHGIIKLKEGVGINGTQRDIVENKKNLKFKEVEAAMLPRILDEVDLALINTNYALEAKLVPTKDALIIEDKDSPYANILVARPDNKDSEGIQALVKALQSKEVQDFINEKYKGAIVPAFEAK